MARPTKFTRELGKAVCSLIELGYSPQAVAGRCGIAYQTLRNWIAGEVASIDEDEHAAFLEDYEKAEAIAECGIIDRIAASDQWTSDAWRAERRFKHWRIPKDEAGSHEHAAPPTIIVQLPSAPSTEPKQ